MIQSHLEEIINIQRYETWVSHGGVSHDSSICDITPYGLLNFNPYPANVENMVSS